MCRALLKSAGYGPQFDNGPAVRICKHIAGAAWVAVGQTLERKTGRNRANSTRACRKPLSADPERPSSLRKNGGVATTTGVAGDTPGGLRCTRYAEKTKRG